MDVLLGENLSAWCLQLLLLSLLHATVEQPDSSAKLMPHLSWPPYLDAYRQRSAI
jgi:hypothetical protein